MLRWGPWFPGNPQSCQHSGNAVQKSGGGWLSETKECEGGLSTTTQSIQSKVKKSFRGSVVAPSPQPVSVLPVPLLIDRQMARAFWASPPSLFTYCIQSLDNHPVSLPDNLNHFALLPGVLAF